MYILYQVACILGLTLGMSMFYQLLRRKFIKWDKQESVELSNKESLITLIFFCLLAWLINARFPATVILIIGFNLVFLVFMAYLDYKTQMLYVTALYVQMIGSAFLYGSALCLGEASLPSGLSLAMASMYLCLVWLFCWTKAIAYGDGAVYISLLPVILLLGKDSGIWCTFLLGITLIIPLLIFTMVEGIRLARKKHLSDFYSLRSPFVPYLLVGFILILIIDISSR